MFRSPLKDFVIVQQLIRDRIESILVSTLLPGEEISSATEMFVMGKCHFGCPAMTLVY